MIIAAEPAGNERLGRSRKTGAVDLLEERRVDPEASEPEESVSEPEDRWS